MAGVGERRAFSGGGEASGRARTPGPSRRRGSVRRPGVRGRRAGAAGRPISWPPGRTCARGGGRGPSLGRRPQGAGGASRRGGLLDELGTQPRPMSPPRCAPTGPSDRLHWVLDTGFGAHLSRVRDRNAASNLADAATDRAQPRVRPPPAPAASRASADGGGTTPSPTASGRRACVSPGSAPSPDGAASRCSRTRPEGQGRREAVGRGRRRAGAARPGLGEPMDASREDAPAHRDLPRGHWPREHWPPIASTNAIERDRPRDRAPLGRGGHRPSDAAAVRPTGRARARGRRRMGRHAAHHEPGRARPRRADRPRQPAHRGSLTGPGPSEGRRSYTTRGGTTATPVRPFAPRSTQGAEEPRSRGTIGPGSGAAHDRRGGSMTRMALHVATPPERDPTRWDRFGRSRLFCCRTFRAPDRSGRDDAEAAGPYSSPSAAWRGSGALRRRALAWAWAAARRASQA